MCPLHPFPLAPFPMLPYATTNTGYDDDFYSLHREAVFDKFDKFIARASTCRNIFSRPQPSSQPLSTSSQTPSQSSNKHTSSTGSLRHIILIEDLPNLLHPHTQEGFHAALQALATSQSAVPVVIIISDAGVRGEAEDGSGAGSGRKEALDIRTVIPRDLLGGPYVTQVA